jgi:hypothetical protein
MRCRWVESIDSEEGRDCDENNESTGHRVNVVAVHNVHLNSDSINLIWNQITTGPEIASYRKKELP